MVASLGLQASILPSLIDPSVLTLNPFYTLQGCISREIEFITVPGTLFFVLAKTRSRPFCFKFKFRCFFAVG